MGSRSPYKSLSLSHLHTLGLVALTIIGFGLRIILLDHFPLREDEAIYSVWALHAWNDDFWLLRVWPDKPPLFLWILGGVFQLFGASQASGRWLNIAFSTLTIPVTAASASYLWGRRAGLVAAVAATLNPFAISFAPTVYTDPLLVLAGVLAIHNALTHRPFWAGLWLGAAMMTKQQGVLYTPLVMGILYWGLQRQLQSKSFGFPVSQQKPNYGLQVLLQFLSGLVLLIAPILYWDSRRWSVAPSPWDLSIENYGALTILPVIQWWTRWPAWSGLVWHLTASWLVWVIFLVLAALQLLSFTQSKRRGDDSPPPPSHSQLMFFFTLWTTTFFAIHVVTSIQVWDRYLLPITPIFALAIAWLTRRWFTHCPPLIIAGAMFIYFCVLIPPALAAAKGELPIGGDHGAYTGIVEATAWLQEEAIDNVVLYHHVLGWGYRFYLFDQITKGQIELRWFPNAIYLADNATKAPHKVRLIMEPDWAPIPNLSSMLAVRGFDVYKHHRFGHITILEVVPRIREVCTWCICKPQHDWLALTLPDDTSMMVRR